MGKWEVSMKYNFEKTRSRMGYDSVKWSELRAYDIGENDGIIPFSVADMEFETAPEIKQALIDRIEGPGLGYERPSEAYFEAVCSWQKNNHDWKIKKEWIIPSHGVVEAFHQAVKAFTKPGDGVILMTPVYYPMYHAIEANSRILIENPLINKGGKYEIDFLDLEEKASNPNNKMLILCSPHNPTGRVWSHDELSKIAEICIKNDVLVVSDEIHSDLIMPGYKHLVYATISDQAKENCIILTSASKTFNLAGLQSSNIIIPNENLRNKYMEELKTNTVFPGSNSLGYIACQAAYENCQTWLNEVLKVINTNSNLVLDFFNKEFPDIVVSTLEGTYLLWIDLRGFGLDYLEIERINRYEAKLFFDEGYIFGENGAGFIRWNLACPTSYIEQALIRFKDAYYKVGKNKKNV